MYNLPFTMYIFFDKLIKPHNLPFAMYNFSLMAKFSG